MCSMPLLLSIGHSNHTAKRFIELLRCHNVTTIVDVRSQPYSQHSPQFNHTSFAALLEGNGIEYLLAGDTLGGRPRGRGYYDSDGRVLYYKVAQSKDFKRGIDRLQSLMAQRDTVAMMCSEEDPTNCHRRLLIGRVLLEAGVEVKHIRGTGRVQEEAELPPTDKGSSPVQKGLFDEVQESSWKSIRPVSPARPLSSFSSH
jgi:uncharacterized protein (DUF488 family)